ncbi:MAG: S8 family serine peptidase [Gemmatimonadota bacterium]
MRRTLPSAAAAVLLVLSACSDAGDVLSPSDATSASALSPTFAMAQEAERVLPGRILAGLADGVDPADVGRAHGLAVTQRHRGFVAFQGATGNERALAARLAGDARVVWAEPDFLRQTSTIDPRLWAFYNPGGLSVDYTRGRNKGSPVTAYLSVDDADEDVMEGSGAGGGAVAIASIDTGVDFGHVEFGAATLVAGWDYYDNDADPSDEDGHGTHTSGTMTGDNVGVAGVAGAASQVTLYVYRVCGALGCPTSAIVSAIYAAADAGVVAMNLSLGGGSLSQTEAAAIDYAVNTRGALVIASAGNDGTSTVSCPACDPNAISVAASDWLDEHAYYTNWGAGLDLIAPGGELYSNTTSEAGIYSSVPGGYAYYQGTSMAAPQVTGAAAVVASKTGARGAALRARLEDGADDLGPTGYDTQFGNGRLNLLAALADGGGDPPPPPPPPPADPLAASFAFACNGQTCAFDASGSTGGITGYRWDFDGDGGWDAIGVTAQHTYSGAGDYTVVLEVTDGMGHDSASAVIQCQSRGPNVRCK